MNRVGGSLGVRGGNGDGNRVGGRNGDVNSGGDGAGAGTATGVEVNEGEIDGNGDGSRDGAGTGTGTGLETRGRSQDGNGDERTVQQLGGGGGRGCNKFVPALGKKPGLFTVHFFGSVQMVMVSKNHGYKWFAVMVFTLSWLEHGWFRKNSVCCGPVYGPRLSLRVGFGPVLGN